jgi:hypothetical protein
MQDFAAYSAGFAQGQADKRNQTSSMAPSQYADDADCAAGYAAGEASVPTYTSQPTNNPPWGASEPDWEHFNPSQTAPSMSPVSPGDWERIVPICLPTPLASIALIVTVVLSA